MQKLFENWRKFRKQNLSEQLPFGGYGHGIPQPYPAGTATGAPPLYKFDKEPVPDEDSNRVVKAVVYRNSHIVLLLNDQGWDLPGGHLKVAEDEKEGLRREIEEETAMLLDMHDMNKIPGVDYDNKTFYSVI